MCEGVCMGACMCVCMYVLVSVLNILCILTVASRCHSSYY